jgi:hypothetical protein
MSPATRSLALLALAKLLLHLATSSGYGFFRDEFYYLACTEHLALGYVDHPPLSIALLWLSRAILGDSLLAIRFLPALAGAATVFTTGIIARELGGRRAAQMLAALAAFIAPLYLALNHFFSMNAFDLLFWVLLAYLAVRMLARNEPRLWLAFGAIAGLGLENKVSVAFLAFGLVVGLLATPQRRLLASRWLWIGGALALLLFLPHLFWQVREGWPTLEFVANAQAEKILPLTPLEFGLQQIVLVHPLNLPLWLGGLAALLVTPRLARFRALGWAYLAVFALLAIQQTKAYYLVPIYPLLFAAGAVQLEAFCLRRRWAWGIPAAAALLATGGAATLPMAVPVLPVETYVAFSASLPFGEPAAERHELGALPQFFADMHGWEELAETVARVQRGLPPGERAGVRVLTRNYGEAGAIDFLGRSRGLPPAISGHNSYFLWGPGDFSGEVLIVLGRSPEELAEWFESVELIDTVRCTWCIPHQDGVPVYVVRKLVVPVEEAWQRLKRFI